MSKIKLNGIEYEFRYSFKNLKELVTAENLDLSKIQEFGGNFTNVPKIIFYGIGKSLTIDEIESALDSEGFDKLVSTIELFGSEVSQYFGGEKSPNDLKNSSVSGSEG